MALPGPLQLSLRQATAESNRSHRLTVTGVSYLWPALVYAHSALNVRYSVRWERGGQQSVTHFTDIAQP